MTITIIGTTGKLGRLTGNALLALLQRFPNLRRNVPFDEVPVRTMTAVDRDAHRR